MHLSTYCGFIVVVALHLAAPIKTSNGCGYDVREIQDRFIDYIEYDVRCRHVT